MLLDRISAEQPRRADTGKDVEVAHAEHHFRPPVDDGRPCDRGFAQRESQRAARRAARRRENLVTIRLPHAARDGADMCGARGDDDDLRPAHLPIVTSGMMARTVIGSGSNCFTHIVPLVFQSHGGVRRMSPV